MATFVIGDIHGCLREFRELLERVRFSTTRDRLWLVGDLVNGGPDSLGVLRWVRRHHRVVTCVLGNHDLYAVARFAGIIDKKKRDTLKRLLAASDAEELLEWLRRRPLIHQRGGHLMVHAGLAPQWSVPLAKGLARELESILESPQAFAFLRRYFRKPKLSWSGKLRGKERLCAALRVLTMIRTCRPSGALCHDFSGPPEEAPPKCIPWYQLRPEGEPTYYFGHWAALGYRALPNAFALDSGCVWGNHLTALRRRDGAVFKVDAAPDAP